MPAQSVATLFIIGGAFATAGGLLGSLQWLESGSRRRTAAQSHWGHHLEQRDLALKHFEKEIKEKYSS